MYTTIWIEGERNLDAFCLKRFKELPRFIEKIGKVGPQAKVYKMYKYRDDLKRYTDMYLLFMEHQKGKVGDITNIMHQTYEQIRTNKTSILIG